MYTKDLNKKITLRLPDVLNQYVIEKSQQLCMTPSEFIRQCVASFRIAEEKANTIINQSFRMNGNTNGGLENGTDLQSNINNKLQ